MILATYSVLNRNCRVNAVLVVEIYVVHTKALKATLTAGTHIFWCTIYNDVIRFDPNNPKFCGNLNFISR